VRTVYYFYISQVLDSDILPLKSALAMVGDDEALPEILRPWTYVGIVEIGLRK
jgi:hypothetical protein